jgi:hypothetical protein
MRSSKQCRPVAALILPLAVLLSLPGELAAQGARLQEGVFLYARSALGTFLSNGGDDVRVCFSQGDYICPRLLPGRSQVLLNSKRGGRLGIWLQDVEGDGRERLCDGDQVSVAPDGRSIVLRRDGAIIKRDLSSGAEQTVSPEGWSACAYPSFCPDGRVLFVATDEGKSKLYSADPADRASPRLLLEAEIETAPRCSPDGRTIAYQNGAHVYLFDFATQRHRRLTFAGGVQSWPLWSKDSKSLAYLQSSSSVDGPWNVYRVAIENPREVSLILRDVQPGPDWDGLGFEGGEPSTLTGEDVRLWASEKPLSLPPEGAELPKPDAGWRSLPPATATTGDVMVECEWGGVYVLSARSAVVLAERTQDAFAKTAEVRLATEQGKPATRAESVTVAEPGVDEVRIEATLGVNGGGTVKAMIGVSRTRPLVEVKPTGDLDRVLVRRPLTLAVLPDRLAADLIYDPADYASPAVSLPQSPFVLGLPASGGGMVMVLTPSRQQTMRLLRDEGAFTGIEARCARESVFVSVLPGDDLWWPAHVTAGSEGEPWQIAWSNPFAAQWRLATQGEDRNLALMRMVDSPTSEETIPLADTGGPPPSRSLVYAYGRSSNTPLERLTPCDVVQDALGLDAASRLFDIEGVRTYRHAPEWVPYKDPRVACKVISWIRTRKRPGVQQKIDDVCHDIVLSLQGLDARTQEYEAFVGELERLTAQGAASDSGKAFLVSVAGQIAALRETLGKRPITPMAEVAAHIEAFRSNADAPYTPFASHVTGALTQRLVALTAYRSLAKSLREEAGLTIARSPEAGDVCERVRDLTGQALRKRYYLEADWLGEQPLGEPEVSYDEIADR